jgi:predicted CoA-binding protein
MSEATATPEEIKAILQNYKVVAVVGLSPKPERPSFQVAQYLKEHGYRIVPVNPGQKEILGETCYRSLTDIPFPVEVVDIFRNVEAIPAIVDEAMAVGARAVWMQLGLAEPVSARKARAAGLEVVMDRCLKVEHAMHAKPLHPPKIT